MIPPKQKERLLNREAFKGSRDLHQNDHIMRTKLKKFFDGIEDVLMILEHLPPQQIQSVISSDELRAAFDLTEATIKAFDLPEIRPPKTDDGKPEAIRRFIIKNPGLYIGPDKLTDANFSLRREAKNEEIAAHSVATVSIDMLNHALRPPAKILDMEATDFILWAKETFPDYQTRFDPTAYWPSSSPREEEEETAPLTEAEAAEIEAEAADMEEGPAPTLHPDMKNFKGTLAPTEPLME